MRRWCLIAFVVAVSVSASWSTAAGKVAAGELDPRVTAIEGLPQGPFITLDGDRLLTVDGEEALVSSDNGKTWERTPIFAEKGVYSIRPERVLLRTKKGTIILAFTNEVEKKWTWDKEKGDAARDSHLPTYVVRSLDGGKTWEPPQMLHEQWTGAIRDIVETRDGKIVFTSMMVLHEPGRHASLTYVSDDEGATWRRSNLIDMGGHGHHDGALEPSIVELQDGRLWMLIRTTLDRLWEAYSEDGGLTWRTLGPTTIDASTAPPMVTRLASSRLVLVWNRLYLEGETDHPRRGGDNQWSAVPSINQRAELSIAFSDDDGRTWTRPAVIARATREYSYPHVFERRRGELWITTMRGQLRVKLLEADFATKAAASPAPLLADQPIRVACTGDSITFGGGKETSYPSQLAGMLPEPWEVRNFGHNGVTALARSYRPYRSVPKFQEGTSYNADVVVLMLGTNDAADTEAKRAHFAADLGALIDHYASLVSRPRIWVCTPPPLMPGRDDDRMATLSDEIAPLIREVAATRGVPVIDLQTLESLRDPALYPDQVHPNAEGYRLIAEAVAEAIQSAMPTATTR